jgi:hypothetical protein
MCGESGGMVRGLNWMGEQSASPPLERRVPGAARAGPAPSVRRESVRRELSDALISRMQAAVDAAHEAKESVHQATDAEPVTEPLSRLQPTVVAQDWPSARSAEPNGTTGDPDLTVEVGRVQSNPAPARVTRSPAGRRRRPAMVGVVVIAALLIAGGVTASVLSLRDNVAPADASKTATALGSARLARDMASAATWVTAQVSHTDVVSCDPAMCQALEQHGFPARHLLRLGPSAPYPLKSTVVVVTPILQRQFGTSLAAHWAPAVLAGFGRGADQVTIHIMAPHGALAYNSALLADGKQRSAVGAGLLTSRQITTTRAAAGAMTAGDVDARLLIVITALASQHPIEILAFGETWPGMTAGIPLRTADFAENVPAAHMSGREYAQAIIAQLRTQPAALRPVYITTVRFAGQKALQIEFPAPSPLGLVSPDQ